MQEKKAIKWIVLVPLVLLLAAASTGIADEPQAVEPSEIACGDSITCNRASAAIRVVNTGTGAALYGENGAHRAGIKGRGQPGVQGYSWGGTGVNAVSTNGVGLKAESDNGRALEAFSSSDWAGYFVASNDNGVYVAAHGQNHIGLYAESDNYIAIEGEVDDPTYGWGFLTGGAIYAGDGCVGCTSMIIALNGSDETLKPGDIAVVTGIAEGPSRQYGRPVLAVRKVDATSSQGVVGVVDGRLVFEPATQEGGGIFKDIRTTEEPAAPGDYLTIVYRGIVQVKVDAAETAIQVGDLLTSDGASGWTVKAQPATAAGTFLTGTILGKAVEPLAEGQGLIWVLVDLQ